MRRTLGLEISSSPIAAASCGACVTMLSTPGGRPASSKISPHSRPPTHGDSSDGFSTTVLPKTSGAVIDRADRISAAFHGAIAPTTPTGRRMPIAVVPGTSDGITWPIGRYAAPAACRNRPGTKCSWNIANPKLAPDSRMRASAISSWRASSRSAAFRKTCCRWPGGVAAQPSKALAAASIARRASAVPEAGAVATTSRVYGSSTSNVRPSAASIHAPPMSCLRAVTAPAVSVVATGAPFLWRHGSQTAVALR